MGLGSGSGEVIHAMSASSSFAGLSVRTQQLFSEQFDDGFYLSQLTHGAARDLREAAEADPAGHFLSAGWHLGLSPCRWFDTLGYLADNPELAEVGINPFLHYLETGMDAGRRPMPFFVDRTSTHPDLKRSGRYEYGPIRHVLNFAAEGAAEPEALPERLAVHIHLYYTEMLGPVATLIGRLPCGFDLLVSTQEDADTEALQTQLSALLPLARSVTVRGVPNRGRDMSPWLVCFQDEIRQSDLFLHLHGKKSAHHSYHSGWFEFLGHSLLGSPAVARQMLSLFAKYPDLGMVAPGYWQMLRRAPNYGKSQDLCRHLTARMGIPLPDICPDFPAGGFFCCRSAVLTPLLDLNLGFQDFPAEEGQICGTLAHAIERLLGQMPGLMGQRFEMVSVDVPFEQAGQQRRTLTPSPLTPDLALQKGPSVSVLCTVARWQDHLPRVLASALDQVPPPTEVILADISEGPRVLTEVMARFPAQLATGQLKLIAPSGVIRADGYNLALDAAEGDILAYQTENRIWAPGYLAQLRAAFRKAPEAMSLYTNLQGAPAGQDSAAGRLRLLGAHRPTMLAQDLMDLTVFAHRRQLTDTGLRFAPDLKEEAGWDFILRATHTQAPLHLDHSYCACLDQGRRPAAPRRDGVRLKHRAERLYWQQDSLQIALKIPAPRPAYKHRWGDLHLAESLAKALDRLGCRTRVDILPDWYTHHPEDDAVIVLRGVTPYTPDPRHINMMWHISHPARVTLDEMRGYDHVCVSAYPEAARIIEQLGMQASVMLQCADPERFHPEVDLTGVPHHDLLFVGNSRKTARWMPQACVDQGLPVAIYGAEWQGLIPPQYVKGTHVPNNRLAAYYRAARIVLNDHWADMADLGFVSNRIMDAGMAGAMVISDHFSGEEALMGQVVTCRNPAEVKEAAQYYLAHEDERLKQAAALHRLVMLHHRVDQRAEQVLKTLRGLHEDRLLGRR
ncbi:rhamnan synthesis F family protein [Donghicola sp. XS_ASV15]|uniref:rhamnan synthesis F family protein n=1 Tax=Donghicola sp. XS_ASV15 TaxID=3241295 RepID=UPI003514B85C